MGFDNMLFVIIWVLTCLARKNKWHRISFPSLGFSTISRESFCMAFLTRRYGSITMAKNTTDWAWIWSRLADTSFQKDNNLHCPHILFYISHNILYILDRYLMYWSMVKIVLSEWSFWRLRSIILFGGMCSFKTFII